MTALLEYFDLEDFFISWQPTESFFLEFLLCFKQRKVEGRFCVASYQQFWKNNGNNGMHCGCPNVMQAGREITVSFGVA